MDETPVMRKPARCARARKATLGDDADASAASAHLQGKARMATIGGASGFAIDT